MNFIKSKKIYSLNPVFFVIFLTLIIYSNSFYSRDFYVIDDIDYINHAYLQDVSWINIKNIFYSLEGIPPGNYYQPLAQILVAMDHSIWGLNPSGYHFTNLLIYIITLIFIYFTVINLFENKPVALLTTLLFAVHPIHVEVVFRISSRCHILSFMFCVMSFYFFLTSIKKESHKRLFFIISLVLFLFAILSHPVSSLLSVIIFLYVYFFSSELKEKKFFNKSFFVIPYFFIAAAFQLVLFLFSLKDQVKMLEGISRPAYYHYYPFITPSLVFLNYCKLLLFPFNLSAFYKIDIKNSFLSPEFILSAFLLLLLAGAFFYSFLKDRMLFPGIAWFIIFYLPVSHWIFPLYMLMQDRYLYYPSFGFFMVFSILTVRLLDYFHKRKEKISSSLKYGRIFISLIVIIICFLSFLTWKRNIIWQDSLSVFNDTLEKYPDMDEVYAFRGAYYYNKKDYLKALDDLNSSIELNPDYMKAYYYRGLIYSQMGDYKNGINDFSNILNFNSDFTDIYYYRGNNYFNLEEYDKAIDDFTEVIKRNPDYYNVYEKRGLSYLKKGKYLDAISDFDISLKQFPSRGTTYSNRALAYYMIKNYDRAWEDVKKLKELGYTADPDFIKLLSDASEKTD